MTVRAPVGRLSWKVGVPLLVLFLGCAVAVWFVPHVLEGLAKLIFSVVVSLAGLLGSLMVLAWMIFDDETRRMQ